MRSNILLASGVFLLLALQFPQKKKVESYCMKTTVIAINTIENLKTTLSAIHKT
jgi:hypothetical protein